MANEITLNLRVAVTNGLLKDDWNPGQLLFNQTTKGNTRLFQAIGTSAESVSFTDITPGFVVLRNHDTTNYVEYGMSDSGTIKILGKLRANGGLAIFELAASTTLMLKANTASCNVEIVATNA